jgi:hypothetical protein
LAGPYASQMPVFPTDGFPDGRYVGWLGVVGEGEGVKMRAWRLTIGLSVLMIGLAVSAGVAAAAPSTVPVEDGVMAGYGADTAGTTGTLVADVTVAKFGCQQPSASLLIDVTVSAKRVPFSSGVSYTCTDGSPSVQYGAVDGIGGVTATAGDVIRFEIQFSPNHVRLVTDDLTTGTSTHYSHRLDHFSVADLFVGRVYTGSSITGPSIIPTFRTMRLSNVNLNGAPLASLPELQEDVAVTGTRQVVIQPSALSANGKGFSLRREYPNAG